MEKIDNTNPYIVTIIGIISLGLLYLGTVCINNVTNYSLISMVFALIGTLIIPVGATLFAIAIISAFRIVRRKIIRQSECPLWVSTGKETGDTNEHHF